MAEETPESISAERIARRPPGTQINGPEQFWARVERGEGCWLWKGIISPSGYGRFECNNKTWQAQRYAYARSLQGANEG